MQRKEEAYPWMNSALRGMISLVKWIPKEKTGPRGKRQLLIFWIWNKTCILLPTCYGNPIMKEKKRREYIPQTPNKWTYNLSIFNFILLHSYWNDKLKIWSTCSAIKSEGKWTLSTVVKLHSHLPPLTDILCRLVRRKIFYVGLVHDTDILVEVPLRYRKTFSLLTFTRIVFFFVSFFYSIKE